MKQALVTGVLAGALIASAPLSLLAQGAAGSAATADTLKAQTLGTVRIPRNVKANGEVLRAGTYQVRLTPEIAKPEAVGTQPALERWVEFVQGGQVKGREVASIVPAGEIDKIAEGKRVPSGGSRVEMLKGDEFVRVWINRGGTHYLIHMPPA
ncbi:MAG TPA: hypothetical protein VNK41_12630 [Vicinamibacterales bacterium]|nr:hypothetical protein [Vicinamibacterales bacterium]